MTIKDFIDTYKVIKSETLKSKALEQINIKTYLPAEEKRALIESVLDTVLFEEDGVYDYNSIDKHLCFTIRTICAYTDLEAENYNTDYDLLSEYNLIQVILHDIGDDYIRLGELFCLRLEDYMRQNNPMRVFNFLLGRFAEVLTANQDTLMQGLQSIDLTALKNSFATRVQ